MEQQETYMTRKEVAEYLRISLPTLHKLVNSNILISYKIGGNVRFKKTDIENLFKTDNNGNNN
jgi:excisionase family DNA binding protein